MQKHVVDGYLVEHLLGQCDGGCLIFEYHSGFQVVVVQHTVGPKALVANAQCYLVGHQQLRITFVVDKEIDEMLPYPFLGSKGYVLATKWVEHSGTRFRASHFYCIRG